MGMRIALSAKLNMGLFRVVKDFNEGQWTKTKQANAALSDGWLKPVELEPIAAQPVIANGVINSEESPVTIEVEEAITDEIVIRKLNVEKATSADATGASDATEAEVSSAVNDIYDTRSIPDVSEEVVPEKLWISRFGKTGKLSILFVHDPKKDPESLWSFARVVRNLPGIEILTTTELQVWHVLKYRWLVMEGSAVDHISKMIRSSMDSQPSIVLDEDLQKASVALNRALITDNDTITLPAVIPDASSESSQIFAKMPSAKRWAIHTWRKPSGSRSVVRALGFRQAAAIAKKAKKVSRKQQREGVRLQKESAWQMRMEKLERQYAARLLASASP
jgi:hypothetical protein